MKNIAIIGLGMIGASLAHDIRTHRLAGHVTGVDINQQNGDYLLTKGLIQSSVTAISDIKNTKMDLVLICTPPSSLGEVAKAIKTIIKQDTIIMDTASVKQYAIDKIAKHIPKNAVFIPTHPIAGKAESGAKAGEAGLFDNKRIIFTPYQEIDEETISKAIGFWENIGGICEIVEADKHDLIYGNISHLPQLIAYAACQTINDLWDNSLKHNKLEQLESLQKFIRLGGSDPKLWADIAICNRQHLSDGASNLLQIISHIKTELNAGKNTDEKPITIPQIQLLTSLLPRIISSSLVSSSQLVEQKHNIEVMPYIGTGFASVAAPALTPPDDDIELISKAYAQISSAISVFEEYFRKTIIALKNNDKKSLYHQLQAGQIAHQHLMQKIG